MSRTGFCSTSVQQLSDKKELCKTAMTYRSVKKRAKDTYIYCNGWMHFSEQMLHKDVLDKERERGGERERERSEKSLLRVCGSLLKI